MLIILYISSLIWLNNRLDFVWEQQLCIEADHTFFQKFPLQESMSVCVVVSVTDKAQHFKKGKIVGYFTRSYL